jgi:hypothetical protein
MFRQYRMAEFTYPPRNPRPLLIQRPPETKLRIPRFRVPARVQMTAPALPVQLRNEPPRRFETPARVNPLPRGVLPTSTTPVPTTTPALTASRPAPTPQSSPRVTPPPTLTDMLTRLHGLPPQTAILGVCDDRLPVLLDLADATPGALLVAGDQRKRRQELLRVLVETSALLNSPRSVQFLILSAQPEEWQEHLQDMQVARHCLGIERISDEGAGRWLAKLAGWTDQRRKGASSGPAVLLVVDDLSAMLDLEYEARVNFDWLIKDGPAVKIWPVVAMDAHQTPHLTRWLRLFKSRILGHAFDESVYRQLAPLNEKESANFLEEDRFAVQVGETWLKFRIPLES